MSMGETALESHTTADPWRATRRRIPGEPHDGGSLESHTTADPWRATRRRIPGEPHDGGSLESHTTADPWRATRRRIPGEPHDGGSLESHTTADPWRATRRRIPGEPHDGGSLESHTTADPWRATRRCILCWRHFYIVTLSLQPPELFLLIASFTGRPRYSASSSSRRPPSVLVAVHVRFSLTAHLTGDTKAASQKQGAFS
ncbi:uncharacterized protein LOC129827738 isoform X1 [Salvelinus fontinalis]|uniref:uncharacterized protein LOC129827738 isoform X1 n=1 Tax=Salvelinus fontinalis TaxID=8038 RepID=UPI002484F503|nr:uncharacterized protein LOC129827738 isoform X1 [Salvelinus fontinalis]